MTISHSIAEGMLHLPCHFLHSPNIFIRSLVLPLGGIETSWENVPIEGNACVSPESDQTTNIKASLSTTRTNAENFVKNVQTGRPRGANLWAKFQILTVFGAAFPHFCTDKHENRFFSEFEFYVYQNNVSPLRGEKPTFGPLIDRVNAIPACAVPVK